MFQSFIRLAGWLLETSALSVYTAFFVPAIVCSLLYLFLIVKTDSVAGYAACTKNDRARQKNE